MSKNKRLSVSESRKFIISQNNSFFVNEAYKTARTNMTFSLSANERQSIVVTSCMPSEGKSTTAVNMAITIAQTGSRVCLIDADLRKPFVHSLLNIKSKNGLSSVLAKFCDLPEAINESVMPNLDVITAGKIPPNPSELLGLERMSMIIQLLEKHYDYVIVDSPPINVVTDAIILGKLCSGLALIVKTGSTRHSDIQKALRSAEITGIKVLGFIKTGCESEMSYYTKYTSTAKKNPLTKDEKSTEVNLLKNEKKGMKTTHLSIRD